MNGSTVAQNVERFSRMGKDCIQLEMNFNGSAGNSFGAHLKSGEFQMLVELPLPG